MLGFGLDRFTDLERKRPHPNENFLQSIGYEQVLYQNEQLEEAFYQICYDAIKEHGLNAWITGGIRTTFKRYSAFIKNPTFSGEYEARIVYYPDHNGTVSGNPLGVSGPETNPFTHDCLPWTRGNGDNVLKVIGLGCNCNLTQSDVNLILSDAGLSGRFELFKSECSYRIRS